VTSARVMLVWSSQFFHAHLSRLQRGSNIPGRPFG
jgi:hypothetical protein